MSARCLVGATGARPSATSEPVRFHTSPSERQVNLHTLRRPTGQTSQFLTGKTVTHVPTHEHGETLQSSQTAVAFSTEALADQAVHSTQQDKT